MAVIPAIRSTIWGSFEGLEQVNLYKVAAWSEGTSRAVRNKEKVINGKGDGIMQQCTSNRSKWNGKVFGIADRYGSGNRDRGSWKRKR